MINETPETIGEWADATFGGIPYQRGKAEMVARALLRAEEESIELAELIEQVSVEPEIIHVLLPKIANEAADICIVLMRFLHSIGYADEINKKMELNRIRTWHPDGTGHAYHCKDPINHNNCRLTQE